MLIVTQYIDTRMCVNMSFNTVMCYYKKCYLQISVMLKITVIQHKHVLLNMNKDENTKLMFTYTFFEHHM